MLRAHAQPKSVRNPLKCVVGEVKNLIVLDFQYSPLAAVAIYMYPPFRNAQLLRALILCEWFSATGCVRVL